MAMIARSHFIEALVGPALVRPSLGIMSMSLASLVDLQGENWTLIHVHIESGPPSVVLCTFQLVDPRTYVTHRLVVQVASCSSAFSASVETQAALQNRSRWSGQRFAVVCSVRADLNCDSFGWFARPTLQFYNLLEGHQVVR